MFCIKGIEKVKKMNIKPRKNQKSSVSLFGFAALCKPDISWFVFRVISGYI